MGFGDKLKELRGEKTQEEVANALEISLSAYRKYESEERNPRDDLKMRISEYFGAPVASIFYCQ